MLTTYIDETCIYIYIYISFYIICVLISPPRIINNHNCNRETYSIVLIYYATNNGLYFSASSQKISDSEYKQVTVTIYYFILKIIHVVSYIIHCINLIVRIIIDDDSFLCTGSLLLYLHTFNKINFYLSKNV